VKNISRNFTLSWLQKRQSTCHFLIFPILILGHPLPPRKGLCQGALALRLELPHDSDISSFWFVTTHFATDPENYTQIVEAGQLTEFLSTELLPTNGEMVPIIVSGDFNSIPHSQPVYEMISSKIQIPGGNNYFYLYDGWEKCGKENHNIRENKFGYTYDSAKPTRRIDYLFISDEPYFKPKNWIQCNSVIVPRTEASDHLPVVGIIQL